MRLLPALLMLLTAAPGATPSGAVAEIVVRLDQPRQTIEGFGASGGWWAQEVGNWPEATRRQVGSWLFDCANGIGVVRHLIAD
jgi:hypothetical protein